ncbi:MAG TPA: ATP-binding cassette domain-containing protein [Cyclobacteriaceae bacterium]|nr:ATP-binding cassette domain-containing protein [Cyclobacteriaceae bacterium]
MQLNIHQLGKRFNRDWIFRNFSYSFKSGNTYAITGPNGSGKSTLLQVLWGQSPPSTGSLEFLDSSGRVIDIQEIYKHISIAAPYIELPESLNLKEIVDFHFSIKNAIKGYSADDLMDLMELSQAKNKFIYQFSSGMKQRLKLGLALFADTELIFLDEPGTNLDKKALAWYKNAFDENFKNRLCFIASNEQDDFPAVYEEISMQNL